MLVNICTRGRRSVDVIHVHTRIRVLPADGGCSTPLKGVKKAVDRVIATCVMKAVGRAAPAFGIQYAVKSGEPDLQRRHESWQFRARSVPRWCTTPTHAGLTAAAP